MSDSERRRWNSGARIDMTTLAILVESAPLQAALDVHGVVLLPCDGAPRGQHPVFVDLWHVESGRLETAGTDQHTWFGQAGAATAAVAAGWTGAAVGSSFGAVGGAAAGAMIGAPVGPVGWWWGAAAGWWAGTAWGAVAGANTGRARGEALGADLGKGWSEAVSRSLGTYDEALVAIPNATLLGGPDRLHMFVLGMFSSGPISIWADRTGGFGYRKRYATIARRGFDRYEIAPSEGGARLSGVFDPAPDEDWAAADRRLDTYRPLFAQPLLGVRPDGLLASSFLDRFLDDPEVRWAPAQARLEIGPNLLEGLPEGTFEVPALSHESPWGAFQASGVLTKVTDPQRQ